MSHEQSSALKAHYFVPHIANYEMHAIRCALALLLSLYVQLVDADFSGLW
jgi:hypothetical protein